VQTENIKSECANITGCRHVDFEHIAIIFVDFFFLIRIRPSSLFVYDLLPFAPVCIIFGFYSIW
jgi:hypothetical protein